MNQIIYTDPITKTHLQLFVERVAHFQTAEGVFPLPQWTSLFFCAAFPPRSPPRMRFDISYVYAPYVPIGRGGLV